MDVIEMNPIEDRPEEQPRPNPINETSIDLPEPYRPLDELVNDVKIEEFISNIRRFKNITGELDKSIYRKLTIDNDGYISYNNKRISLKGSRDISSVKTLEKSVDGREFLRKLGYYERQEHSVVKDGDLRNVSQDQGESI